MKPHLLYVAFWFPPSRASGVYRALATTRAFVNAGWKVTVVTTTREYLEDVVGSVDESLESLIPDIDIVRVPFAGANRRVLDIRSLGWLRANFPYLWLGLRDKMAPLRNAVSIVKGDTQPAHGIRDDYVAWIEPVVKAGRRIHSRTPIDHVLATGNPFSSFEAARLLGGLIGAPYSLDYRDPWTIDVFTGNPDHADSMTTTTERKIVEGAHACFHVNQPIADAYKSKYPESADKQYVVYNGFDPESVQTESARKAPNGPITFGMLGTVNDRWPLEPILEAWLDCRTDLPAGSELILGGHLGYFARSREPLEALLPDERFGFRYVGPINKRAVSDFYASIDVVVVPVPGGTMVTSGKIFEALALGIPIVCVQEKNGGARRLITDHPLAFSADPDARSTRKALLSAGDAASHLDPHQSEELRKAAKPYERTVAVDRLVEIVSRGTLGETRDSSTEAFSHS